MPSKKQRRRRAKERRHDYEVVYVDEVGNELDPEEVAQSETQAKSNGKDPRSSRPSARPRSSGTSRGAMRPVPEPSWTRVLKRGAVFAPFMFVTLWLLGGRDMSSFRIVSQSLFLLVLFVPFSYLVDRMMYRRYVRQKADAPPPRRQRRA
jgi:hypothetical protein